MAAYKSNGTYISYQDQANELPAIKEMFPRFKQVHSQVLQDVLKRIDKAFRNFFRRVKQGSKQPGFPRFRSFERFSSITYTQSGFAIKGSRIELSKTGSVRLRLSREIPIGAAIKTCNIKKEGSQWYCAIVFETNISIKKKVVISATGIDLGIENFATLSNGEVVSNPRYLRKSADKIGQMHARYSKRKTKTLRKKLATLHKKVVNQRKDFLHKTSRTLVNTYDLIAYEYLNIKNMSKRCKPVLNKDGSFAGNGQARKSGLNKSINDAGWGMFINMIIYKAESAGGYAVAVNPQNTSQICSNCGAVVKKKLSERLHCCPVCEYSVHRDLNASLNILRLGTDRRTFISEIATP